MIVSWSPSAIRDMEHIGNYLQENKPSLLKPTFLKLLNAAESLKQFPNRGRMGREDGTREMVITFMPYIIVYQVTPKAIDIVRVLHTAENWP